MLLCAMIDDVVLVAFWQLRMIARVNLLKRHFDGLLLLTDASTVFLWWAAAVCIVVLFFLRSLLPGIIRSTISINNLYVQTYILKLPVI